MEKVSTPTVQIAGVFLPTQNFVWRFTSGVEPYTATFIVPITESKKLEEVQNPVTMTINFPTATGISQLEPSEQVINNLYLVSRRHIDLVNVEWTITDARWILQGKKIYAAYNKTLPSKSVISTYSGDIGNSSSLREYWDTLSKGRYVWWTVKIDGKPYSMQEIIENELKSLGMIVQKGNIESTTSYTIDNVIMDGSDAVKTIAEFLQLAKESMSVNKNGQVYVYSVYSYGEADGAIKQLARSKVAKGCLYQQQKKKGRPKSINVLFEKKVETMIVATNEDRSPIDMGTNSGINARYTTALKPRFEQSLKWLEMGDYIKKARIIGCVNVVKCPFNIQVGTIQYNAGEYIPFSYFFEAFGLSESFLTEKAWFNGGLELRLSAHFRVFWKKSILTADLNNRIQLIGGAIQSHWRKTYQIDPYYLDYMKSWDVRRASVINSYDGRTAPSNVFANHFYIPYARPMEAIAENNWKTSSYSWDVAKNDASLNRPAPATLSVINEKIGIFQVNYPKPIDTGTSLTGNFSLTSVPFPSPENLSSTLDFCYPTISHTFISIITVVWHKDPSFEAKYSLNVGDIISGITDTNLASGKKLKSQYYSIEVKPTIEGEFSSWEVASIAEYARMKLYVKDIGTTVAGVVAAVLKGVVSNPTLIKDVPSLTLAISDEPENKAYLSAIANYEAGRIYNLFNDLYAGSLTVPGLLGEIEVSGNLACITYSLSPQTGATTTYEFLDVMPYAPIEATIPQRYIDYIRKNISRGDTVSDVHIAK